MLKISATGIVYLLLVCFLAILILLVFWFFFSSNNLKKPENAIYNNPAYSVEERVSDLLSHMTLEEKIGQMALVEKNSIRRQRDISNYGLGAMLSGFGAKPDDNSTAGWKSMVEGFVGESKQSRLGIPILYGVDAIHGHSNVPGMTVFPHAIGLGASGDEEMVKKVAQATKEQLLATGVRWNYSPTYDMPQDIRWGRVYESFSDDPVLVSKLTSAYIEGLQENITNRSEIAVLATPKHFIGAGSMLWNTSSNENFKIDQGTTPKNEEDLYDYYLPPFKQAIESGALSIMVGLNSWGETKLAAESRLINKVLKDELSFDGFVVSDWYGVYEISGSDYDSAVIAINAGVDMVMLPFDYRSFIKNIEKAVADGEISESRINDAVERILRAKFTLGLFDDQGSEELLSIDAESHANIARAAVAKSAVLLKNNNNVLPLAKDEDIVLVAGSAADNVGIQSGAWTIEWQGVDGNWLPGSTSILKGIREMVGSDTVVNYEKNARFGTEQKKVPVGIAVVGEKSYAEGWGDNDSPVLSMEDIATIKQLRDFADRVVVVLVTGRPLIISKEIEAWDSLVVVWLPGSEGGGVADVLFGEELFTGRLPMPWPADIKQLPISPKGVTRDGSKVLYPRYFGINSL